MIDLCAKRHILGGAIANCNSAMTLALLDSVEVTEIDCVSDGLELLSEKGDGQQNFFV